MILKRREWQTGKGTDVELQERLAGRELVESAVRSPWGTQGWGVGSTEKAHTGPREMGEGAFIGQQSWGTAPSAWRQVGEGKRLLSTYCVPPGQAHATPGKTESHTGSSGRCDKVPQTAWLKTVGSYALGLTSQHRSLPPGAGGGPLPLPASGGPRLRQPLCCLPCGCVAAISAPSSHSRESPLCVCVPESLYKSPLLTRTPAIGCRAHPNPA